MKSWTLEAFNNINEHLLNLEIIAMICENALPIKDIYVENDHDEHFTVQDMSPLLYTMGKALVNGAPRHMPKFYPRMNSDQTLIIRKDFTFTLDIIEMAIISK